MKKRPKLKPNKEAIRDVFPPEVVEELDRIISEVDSDVPTMENPHKRGARPVKPWGKKWVKRKGKL